MKGKFILGILLALGLVFGSLSQAGAAISVTAATGGSAISADDYADSSLTALTGPTIISGAANDIQDTLIIVAPSNFRFATDSIVTATLTNGGVTTLELTDSTVTPTSVGDSILFVVTTASGVNDSVIISGLYVFPIDNTPQTQNITVDPDAAGGAAAVNAGALTIVHGAATKLAWTTQPNSPRQAGQQFTTGTVGIQDQYGNTVTTGADATAVITVKAYRSDNWLLSDGLWNEGTIANTTGVIDTAAAGVVDFAANPKFDFSKAGGYYFVATANGAAKASLASDTSNAVTITFDETPGNMTVNLTAPMTMEVNSYSTNNVTAVLRDGYNNPVVDSTLVFGRIYGTGGYFRDNSSTACTVTVNFNGYAEATYNSGHDVSTGDSIKVYLLANGSEISGVNERAGITLTPGALTTVDVIPEDYGITNPDERVVVDSTSDWFTAELQDYWGNHIDAEDVAGKRILVRVDGPSRPWTGDRHTTPGLYGSTGSVVWRFKYIAGQTVTSTPDTILAKNDADTTIYDEVYAKVIGGPVASDSLFLTWHAPDDSAVTVCNDSSNTIDFDIVAKDQYGNLTENWVIDYSLSGTGDYGSFAASADTTDALGEASGTYQAGSTAQLVTLTATAAVGGATANKLIALEAEPLATDVDSIEITSSMGSSISAGQTAVLTFTYFDEFGNEVDITWNTPGDTSFTNADPALGTLAAATTADTLTPGWPRVFGVTFKKNYQVTDTLTVVKYDTIVAVANSVADTFVVAVVPAGDVDYFEITYDTTEATVNDWITLTLKPFDGVGNQIYSYNTVGLSFDFTGASGSSQLSWVGLGACTTLTEDANGDAYLPDTTIPGGSFQFKLTTTLAEGAYITVADTNVASSFETQNTSVLTWTPESLDSFAIVAQSGDIYTGTPFTVTVSPQDVYDNTITATSYWIDFSANELGVTLPNGTQQITGATDYQVTADNPSTTLKITVTKHDDIAYFGISGDITVLAATLGSPTIDSLYDIANDEGTRVRMRFTGSADELGGIYKIQRKIGVAKSTNWDDVLDLEAGSEDGVYNAIVPTLEDSIWSWFRVLYARVIGDNTYYAISAEDSVMSIDDIPPTAAQFVRGMDTPGDVGGSITVTWNLSSSDGIVRPAQGIFPEVYGVFEYWIYRDEVKVGAVGKGATEYTDETVENYPITYNYTVYAYDGTNLSEVSNTEGAYAADNTQIADFTSDQYVDVNDLSLLADHWHIYNTALDWDDIYDLVADGYIDVNDLSVMADHWHEGTPAQLPPGPNAEAEVIMEYTAGSSPDQLVVEISATKVNNLSGYEFTLSYDADRLTFLEASGGELLNSLGGETPVLLSISTSGELKLANVIARAREETAPEGDGLIARINFRMEGKDADLKLDDIIFMDVNGTKDVIPSPTGVNPLHIGGLVPRVYSLNQNYPNPFNPTTQIMYGLPKDSQVELKVFNIMGQEVTTLVNGWQKAGYRSIVWDGRDSSGHPVASGVYFYRLEAGEFNSIKKMVLLK